MTYPPEVYKACAEKLAMLFAGEQAELKDLHKQQRAFDAAAAAGGMTTSTASDHRKNTARLAELLQKKRSRAAAIKTVRKWGPGVAAGTAALGAGAYLTKRHLDKNKAPGS